MIMWSIWQVTKKFHYLIYLQSGEKTWKITFLNVVSLRSYWWSMRRNFAVWRVNSQHFIGKSCGLLPPCPPAPVPSVSCSGPGSDRTEERRPAPFPGGSAQRSDLVRTPELRAVCHCLPEWRVLQGGAIWRHEREHQGTSSPLFWPTELASSHICPRGYSPLMAELELFDFSWSHSPSSLKF